MFCASGKWRARKHEKEWSELRRLEEQHLEVVYHWVPRELNAEADDLARAGMRVKCTTPS